MQTYCEHLDAIKLSVRTIDWFDVMGAGDVVPAKKPAPDIYRYVLNELRLEPDRCLAFEDSELGLRSSLGANLKTIVTVNPYTTVQDFTGAALVIDNLGELAQPNHILAGNGFGSTYVDVSLLWKLFGSK